MNGAVPLLPYMLFIAWGEMLPLLSHVTFLVHKIFKPEKPLVISFKRDGGVDVGDTSFTNFTYKFDLEFYIHVTMSRYRFLFNNQPNALIQIYSVIKFYMFRATSLPIIRSFLLYIRHW